MVLPVAARPWVVRYPLGRRDRIDPPVDRGARHTEVPRRKQRWCVGLCWRPGTNPLMLRSRRSRVALVRPIRSRPVHRAVMVGTAHRPVLPTTFQRAVAQLAARGQDSALWRPLHSREPAERRSAPPWQTRVTRHTASSERSSLPACRGPASAPWHVLQAGTQSRRSGGCWRSWPNACRRLQVMSLGLASRQVLWRHPRLLAGHQRHRQKDAALTARVMLLAACWSSPVRDRSSLCPPSRPCSWQ